MVQGLISAGKTKSAGFLWGVSQGGTKFSKSWCDSSE